MIPLSTARPQRPSRSERFYSGYVWLILKNLLGWLLILLALVVGPLVPGPGGIPLFLLGFALIWFPGKRRLTSRVLRGRRLAPVRGRWLWAIFITSSLVVPMLLLPLAAEPLADLRPAASGPAILIPAYAIGVGGMWLLAAGARLAANLLLIIIPKIRRRVRPWLRRHRIRLLPPRRRPRHSHEAGTGPFRLKDEILGFLKPQDR